MTHMLLRYIEDPDAYEIIPKICINSKNNKIGGKVKYRHPEYHTEFERILLHTGSERSCKEFQRIRMNRERSHSSGMMSTQTMAPSKMHNLRSIKRERSSPRAANKSSIKATKEKDSKRISVVPPIKNPHRDGTPDSLDRSSSNSSPARSMDSHRGGTHSSPPSTPLQNGRTVSSSSSDGNTGMNMGTEALEILRFLKSNISSKPIWRYNGHDFLPREEVLELSEEYPSNIAFVRVLLDTIFSEDEKKLPLEQRDKLKVKWVKEQFRVLKSHSPEEFNGKWREAIRRYRHNIVRRAKGGYESLIQSKVDDD